MISEPPLPSMVSAPEPPLIVFAAVEPRIESAVVVAVAVTLLKPVTEGPPLTSLPEADRFTFVATAR